MGFRRSDGSKRKGRAGRSLKLLLWLGAALFFLLDLVQILAGPTVSSSMSRGGEGPFFVSMPQEGGGCPYSLLPMDDVAVFPPGKWKVRVHAFLRREKTEKVLAVVPGKIFLSGARGVSFRGGRTVVSGAGAGKDAFVEVRLDFPTLDSCPAPAPWERTRVFLFFRNLYERNPCLPDGEVRVIRGGGGVETFLLGRISHAGRAGPLLSRFNLRTGKFEQKGFGYLIRRELGLPGGKEWVYTQDGPLTILQRRLDVPLAKVGFLRVFLSPEAVLDRLNFRVGGGVLSPSRVVPFSAIPVKVFRRPGETVVEADLRPLGGKKWEGSARLLEIVLGLPGDCADFLRDRWVREVALYSPGKPGEKKAALGVVQAGFRDAGGGERALVLEFPFRVRGILLRFRPSTTFLPWGNSFAGGRMVLWKPSRAPALLPKVPQELLDKANSPVERGQAFPAVETVAFWARGHRGPVRAGGGFPGGKRGPFVEGKIRLVGEKDWPARFAWELEGIPKGGYWLEVKPGRGRDCRLAWALPFRRGKAGKKSWSRADGRVALRGPLDRVLFALEGPGNLDLRCLDAVHLFRVVWLPQGEILDRKRLLGGIYPFRSVSVHAPPGLEIRKKESSLRLRGLWMKGERGPIRVLLRAGEDVFFAQSLVVEAGRPFPSRTRDPWRVSFTPFPGWSRGLEGVGLSGEGWPCFRCLPSEPAGTGAGRGGGVFGGFLLIYPPADVSGRGDWVSLDLRFRWRGWKFASPLGEALRRPFLRWGNRPLSLRVAGNPSMDAVLRRGLWLEGDFQASRPRTSWNGLLRLLPNGGLDVDRVVLESPAAIRQAPRRALGGSGGLGSWGLPQGAGAELLGLALLFLALLWRPVLTRAALLLCGAGGHGSPRIAYLLGFITALGFGWILLFLGRNGLATPFFVFALYMLVGLGISVRPAGKDQP